MKYRSSLVRLATLGLTVAAFFALVNSPVVAASWSNSSFSSNPDAARTVRQDHSSNASLPDGEVLQAGLVPTAVDDADTTAEDVPTKTNVTSNDFTGDWPHQLGIVISPSHGNANPNGKENITYTPAPNYYGSDSYVYNVCDKDGECSSATVTITITPVNDPPNAVDDSASTPVNTVVTIAVLINDSDVENDTLLLQSFDTTSSQGGTVARYDNGTPGDFSDDRVTYTPASNFSGTDIFSYQVSDGSASANAQVIVTVSGQTNAPPLATDDSYTTPKNTTFMVPAPGILGNDSDPNGDSLTAILGSGTTHGVLSLNANGSFTYTPDTDFSGQDTFTYYANDGALDSNTAIVTLTVQEGNVPPLAGDDAYSIPLNNALSVSAPGLLVNDSDPDGDSLRAVPVSGPGNGTLTLNEDGSFAYTPTTNFFGLDSFTYQASDGISNSNLATVTIEVLEGNIAPTAGDDSYSVLRNQILSVGIPGVLQNDSDLNGDAFSAVLDDTSDHGTLTLKPDGSFTYVPQTDFVGVDIFRYRASDGSMISNTAQVTISVVEADTEVPNVSWLSPVADKESINVFDDEVIRLEASATDNMGISSVRFYRWDPDNLLYVEIGMVYAAPYRWDLDTSQLNWGPNQINAQAYDVYGNVSDISHIWVYKLWRVFMPVSMN